MSMPTFLHGAARIIDLALRLISYGEALAEKGKSALRDVERWIVEMMAMKITSTDALRKMHALEMTMAEEVAEMEAKLREQRAKTLADLNKKFPA